MLKIPIKQLIQDEEANEELWGCLVWGDSEMGMRKFYDTHVCF